MTSDTGQDVTFQPLKFSRIAQGKINTLIIDKKMIVTGITLTSSDNSGLSAMVDPSGMVVWTDGEMAQ